MNIAREKKRGKSLSFAFNQEEFAATKPDTTKMGKKHSFLERGMFA